MSKGNYRHGGNRTPEWYTWCGLRQRCLNPNNPAYPRYGGRGIGVAPEWLGKHGFSAFLEHVGKRPTPDHSLDRIDNDRGYEPGNVRWATAAQQAHNTRKTKLAPHEPMQIRWLVSEGYTQRQIAAAFGIDKSLVHLVAHNRVWVEDCDV